MAVIRKYAFWVLLPILATAYYLFAFHIERSDFNALIWVFSILTLGGVIIYLQLRNKKWWILFAVGLFFRLIFLFAPTHLSDDFFRFTWDGELQKDGYSAFQFLPSEFASNVRAEDSLKYSKLLTASNEEFPKGMNSKNYFSIYPAVNQFVFYSAVCIGTPNQGNLVVIRIWILLAELVSFFALRALLRAQQKEPLLGLYWLHPLLIIELTGNLHLEALAITFILLALYFAVKNKFFATAASIALGIMTKLTPLLLLGAFFKDRNFKQWVALCALSGIFAIGLFATIVDLETLANFKGSVGLYFAWFSFNAGPYYILRDLAQLIGLGDISATLSLYFPFITIALGALIVFKWRHNVVVTLLLLFTVYFMLSPLVHPWYITVLIPLAVLSQKIYPLVWSLLIFGTYMAYGESFEHPLWWIYFEYLVVLGVLFLEFRKTSNAIHRLQKWCFCTGTEIVK